MKKDSAVIFDCDGVMFESRQANINFYNHILKRYGLPPMTEEQISYVHVQTAEKSIECILHGSPFLEQAQAYRKTMDYTPFIKDMVMEDGLKELLTELKPDYGLGVATSRSNTIGKVLEWNGLDRFFDIVVSSLDVKQPKPHPESLHKILRFFGIAPQQAYYIGDSAVDSKTARAAGVPFIAFKNRDLEADYCVENLKEVSRILKAET